jgi:PAS domain-containing protein
VRELEDELAAARVAHAEVSQREARLDRAVRGSTVCLWDWHVGTTEAHYDERFAELLGYVPGEDDCDLTFENFSERLHPDDRALNTEAINRHLEENVLYDIEYRLRCKDGEAG